MHLQVTTPCFRKKKMHSEEKTMACNPPFRSPKQEEEEEEFPVMKPNLNDNPMDELEGFWGIQGDDKFGGGSPILNNDWDFMNWDEFSNVGLKEEESDDVDHHDHDKIPKMEMECDNYNDSSIAVKRERLGCFWDEEKTISLNLNYQEVLDAWSDGRSPWADDFSLSTSNDGFMGEVPVMEEEKMRREARVRRYKEKRHSRLFSKKIRYQVRKLNAEKRPRLKGRFVKRVADKTMR